MTHNPRTGPDPSDEAVEPGNRNGRSLRRFLADVERSAIVRALESRRGSVSAAAEDLGLSRQGLYKKLRRLSISPSDITSSLAGSDSHVASRTGETA